MPNKPLELNHTPPVWTAIHNCFIEGANGNVCIVMPDLPEISAAERAANIRLICAAPEMLNACLLAIKSLSDGQTPDLAVSVLSHAVERALGQTIVFENGVICSKGEKHG